MAKIVTRSPIRWIGGKGMLVHHLLPLVPPHKHYVEVFGGGASLLFAKPPCGGVEVYNDVDEGLVGFFRVLREPRKFLRFMRRVMLVPYSRAEYNLCRKTWRQQKDEVERALRWYVVARMSFSGHFAHSFANCVTETRGGIVKSCYEWNKIRERLVEMHERFRTVQIECAGWPWILDRYNVEGYLAYCDPPYHPETRRRPKRSFYEHEMPDFEHETLVSMLLDYPAMAMVSGYDCPIYKRLDEANWTRREIKTSCHSAGRTRASGNQGKGSARKRHARTEVVWRNPKAMEALSDG